MPLPILAILLSCCQSASKLLPLWQDLKIGAGMLGSVEKAWNEI
jgi:hypothetical protein